MHALVRRVRSLRPDVRVETGFLDFNIPSVQGVLESLAAEGVRDVVALPLLLTRAFHAKSDIPAVLRDAPPQLRIRQAEVLGPSPRLLAALERRLYEAGLRPQDKSSTGVVLASAGSTDPEAIAVISGVAREWERSGWGAVRVAFASATLPRTEDAVRELRELGWGRVAVAPYVLAPGFLPDRIARGAVEAGADGLAGVLGASVEVGGVVLGRYA
ncbi:cobalamin (vitamin B12) biosynthesis CbiX protein, partial [Actinobacteria bacterium OK074]